MRHKTKKLCFAGLSLALCLILPFFTGQIPEIGNMLSPMHIPVLLCGLICGPVYGALVGFIAPFLRYFLFNMPPLIPSAPGGPSGLSMAFEMAAYGFVSGVCIKLFKFSIKMLAPGSTRCSESTTRPRITPTAGSSLAPSANTGLHKTVESNNKPVAFANLFICYAL